MKYKIIIEEMIAQEFSVEADSSKGAMELAIKKYKKGEFVLEPGEIGCKQICVEDDDGYASEWVDF
ncbi:MAG: DpnD/PcfM family protein [Erysipelotrichaceae bacterium]